jgi:hypothetical protein
MSVSPGASLCRCCHCHTARLASSEYSHYDSCQSDDFSRMSEFVDWEKMDLEGRDRACGVDWGLVALALLAFAVYWYCPREFFDFELYL